LVGTKTDLGEQREVTVVEGQELATKLQCPFTEVSPCSRPDNIDRLFVTALDLVKLDPRVEMVLRYPQNIEEKVLQALQLQRRSQ